MNFGQMIYNSIHKKLGEIGINSPATNCRMTRFAIGLLKKAKAYAMLLKKYGRSAVLHASFSII